MARKGNAAATPRTRGTLVLWALLGLAWLGSGTAGATFPGEEGAIAFQRGSEFQGGSEIWATDPDGTAQVRLSCAGLGPGWSPDGQRIAYARSPGDPDGSPLIFVADGSGGGEIRITSGHRPVWSPDGQGIAYTIPWNPAKGLDPEPDEVYVINTDGSGRVSLGPGSVTRQPWSPNGQRVVLVGQSPSWADDGFEGLFLGDAATGERTRLTDDGGSPAWSSGGVIAFGRGGDIWTMNADGSGETQLTDTPEADTAPLWSPDGETIALQRAGAVWIMNADGGDQRRLVANARAPTWSPDGRRIAFERGGDIWVINADRSGEARLTDDPAPESGPEWQPTPARVGDRACFRLSVSGVGTGTGEIRDASGLIACEKTFFRNPYYAACAARLAAGTEVTLTAAPWGRSMFSSWGRDCTGRGSCELTMNGDRRVSARFMQTGVPPRFVIDRARVRVTTTRQGRTVRRLVVRGSVSHRGTPGEVSGTFEAAGQWTPVYADIRRNSRLRLTHVLRGPQRRARAGSLRLRYGSGKTRSVSVRLHAARRPVRLRLDPTRLEGKRLVVAGSVRPQARGQARIQVQFNRPNGVAARIATRARVNRRGRFHTRLRLPPAARGRGAWVSVTHRGRGRVFGQVRGQRVPG